MIICKKRIRNIDRYIKAVRRIRAAPPERNLELDLCRVFLAGIFYV